MCVIFGNLYLNASMAQDCTDLLDLNQSSSQSGHECVARETLKTYSHVVHHEADSTLIDSDLRKELKDLKCAGVVIIHRASP